MDERVTTNHEGVGSSPTGAIEFCGRRVYYRKLQYPCVYWPEHPVAGTQGHADIHRLVAHSIWGDAVFGKVVHHKNHDIRDWRAENLELLDQGTHLAIHRWRGAVPYGTERPCGSCGATVVMRTSRQSWREKAYCSFACAAKGREKVDWPGHAQLVEMVRATNFLAVGRALGVSDNAVRKRLKKHLGLG